MFSALICLSFLPWSILNLKEKFGRVILAELNSFPSHSSLSLDNLLTHCNNNIRSCLEGSDATFISTLHVKNTNAVSRRITVDLHHERISLNNSNKVNGLECYFKGILCKIDRKVIKYS